MNLNSIVKRFLEQNLDRVSKFTLHILCKIPTSYDFRGTDRLDYTCASFCKKKTEVY